MGGEKSAAVMMLQGASKSRRTAIAPLFATDPTNPFHCRVSERTQLVGEVDRLRACFDSELASVRE